MFILNRDVFAKRFDKVRTPIAIEDKLLSYLTNPLKDETLSLLHGNAFTKRFDKVKTPIEDGALSHST